LAESGRESRVFAIVESLMVSNLLSLGETKDESLLGGSFAVALEPFSGEEVGSGQVVEAMVVMKISMRHHMVLVVSMVTVVEVLSCCSSSLFLLLLFSFVSDGSFLGHTTVHLSGRLFLIYFQN
ncbi:hypothetical protein PFISCL1PPCAC_26555, partial [Pristionchus fissidentatus]